MCLPRHNIYFYISLLVNTSMSVTKIAPFVTATASPSRVIKKTPATHLLLLLLAQQPAAPTLEGEDYKLK